MSRIQESESGVGVRSWNQESESGVGVRSRSQESESGVGVRRGVIYITASQILYRTQELE